MQSLSWNEIQDRAVEFASKWEGETYEKGESQSFWGEFLTIFGIDRKRHGALFEYAIKKNGGSQGFVDMFWPGKFLAEQKSAGRDLSKAQVQARDYLHNMPDHDLPIGIAVSDFANFEFINLETDEHTKFKLADLPKNVKLFGFLIGEQSRNLAEQDPVNRKAAEAMAALHNELSASGYTGHSLEVLLVRIVFCLFADDSGIFEQGSFEDYVYNRTTVDGTDLGPKLIKFFEVLNTKQAERSSNLDDALKIFEYINGGLFAEQIKIPDFNHKMRDVLLNTMKLDWSKVSPAIFGSMFQGVMDEKQRRNLGAHYTSEVNILRVIKPLFLDELYEEFAKVKNSNAKLREFQKKLANLKFLDPACGCGNKLVITYRELRRLEHKVLEVLYGKTSGLFDIGSTGLIMCDISQMYGVEIEEFPSLVAQTAMWLTDHQMNMEFSAESGKTFKRIPLTTSATIVHGNALTIDWNSVILAENLNYIISNPPYNGSKTMTAEMRADLRAQFGDYKGNIGVLDFVSAWYAKAAKMMQANPKIEAALVSTNSITQGEQVGILWKYLLDKGIKINFAHRTFKWTNDAKGIAGVHCVIIGFALFEKRVKRLFEYDDIKGEPTETVAKNINPYLINADNILIFTRQKPISGMEELGIGNKPIDGGYYLFSTDQKNEFIKNEPASEKYFRLWMGAEEFINNTERWCLWLGNVDPKTLKTMPHVLSVIDNVQKYRLQSKSKPTQALASTPTRFHVENMPTDTYLVIPEVSSEKRNYIPIGFLESDILSSNRLKLIRNSNLYYFGVLSSQIHMAWMRAVAGRLESRYVYSVKVVYNNFVWPEANEKQTTEIEKLSQDVLDARAQYPEASLADLYNPLTMPVNLSKAHKTLDRAVDRLYRKEGFTSDPDRITHLFTLYQEKTKI